MRRSIFLLSMFLVISMQTPAVSEELHFSILHTNDLHSHLLGASPNIDYSPDVAMNDKTLGGWARIATVIEDIREKSESPVLVLDGGDFLMGSLFHMISRETAAEIRLLGAMGYDIVTLGNHEFDLKPGGLARILKTAAGEGNIPEIVLANAVFDSESVEDDTLENVFQSGAVKPYTIRNLGGIRIGFFGLMGKDAAEVAPFASPIRFEDPIAAAQRVVTELRDHHRVDLVICLSHSGLSDDPDRSEDEILAKSVAGIDIIISGHTHTKLEEVRQIDDTMIVQAGSYGKHVGHLEVVWDGRELRKTGYRLIRIDDSIAGHAGISRQISNFQAEVERRILAEREWAFTEPLAETRFPLYLENAESNLGNLISDSIRWSINRSLAGTPGASPVQVGVISNGVIRDPIETGRTGKIAVCDAFRALPLGIGFDSEETMGYPLIALYIYPYELKKALEILTSIYPLKGSDYYLQISGVRFSYNPNRLIFDRVTDVSIGDEHSGYHPLDTSRSNRTLIGVGADIYNATFLKVVGDFTWHILDIIPKDAQGTPINDLREARIDSDPKRAGVQELKEWVGFLDYLAQFPDSDGDGLGEIPEMYRGQLGRHHVAASWNPYHLLRGGTMLTWGVFGLLVAMVGIFVLGSRFVWKRIRKK